MEENILKIYLILKINMKCTICFNPFFDLNKPVTEKKRKDFSEVCEVILHLY